MKGNCNDYLKRSHMPHINTPEAFNLDKYIENDTSKEKRRASAWGSGDFKSLIKMNGKRFNHSECEGKKNGMQ